MRTVTKLMLGLVVPAALMAAETAFAAKITQWSYETEVGFVSTTGTSVTVDTINTHPTFDLLGNTVGNPAAGLATTLSWGVPATASGKSKFRLSDTGGVDTTGKIAGTVVTDGAFVEDVSLFHNNFQIFIGSGLTGTTIVGSLLLDALVPATGDVFGPLTGIFQLVFKETNNSGESSLGGFCADGSPKPCPDIFVLTNAGALGPQFLGTIMGFEYTLNLAIAGLTPVGNEGCALVGQAAGCLGFITPEDGISQLDVSFNLTSKNTNVPEPGMLALLGLGLAGLGFSQVRRRK